MHSGFEDKSPLFPSSEPPYSSLTPLGAWKIVKRAALRAGLPKDISPHWFRHGHAFLALKAGVNLKVLQTLLGHASISTTADYVAVMPSEGTSLFIQPV